MVAQESLFYAVALLIAAGADASSAAVGMLLNGANLAGMLLLISDSVRAQLTNVGRACMEAN